MQERREFPRSNLPQKAIFFGAKGWEDCIITEASRKGLGVKFYTRVEINEGSIIHLKVFLLSQPHPIEVKGFLKWIEKKGKHFLGGIEWFHIGRGETKEEVLRS